MGKATHNNTPNTYFFSCHVDLFHVNMSETYNMTATLKMGKNSVVWMRWQMGAYMTQERHGEEGM